MGHLSYLPILLIGVTCTFGLDPLFYPSTGDAAVSTSSLPELVEAIQGGNTVVAHFTVPATDDSDKSMRRINELMLQLVAQALQSRNVSVMCVHIDGHQTLAGQHGVVADSVLVYKQGEGYLYNGHRSPEPLIAFVHKLDTPVVTIVQNKLDKKEFDHVCTTKVIGYFQAWPTSPEMLAFEAAAKQHYPSIPFFAVVTPEMAESLRFSAMGEVHIKHPYEKIPHVLTQNPATQADISTFLQANGHPNIQRLSMDNLHSVWDNAEEARIVALGSQRSPLIKTIKNMAKSGLLQNITEKTILLFDPADFPMLVDHWQTTFQIDLSLPGLGLINATDKTASWADLTEFMMMNATDQVAYISLWLEAISMGRVRVDGQVVPPSAARLDEVARDAVLMATKAAEAAQAAAAAAQAAAQAAQAAQAANAPPAPPATPPATPPAEDNLKAEPTVEAVRAKDDL